MMVDADLDLLSGRLEGHQLITVLAGGVGAARLLAGLVQVVPPDGAHRHRQRRRRRRAARAAHQPRPRHRSPTPWPAPSTPSGAGAWPARPGRPWRRSAATRGPRPGSASATGTSPPTCTAPTACGPGPRLSEVTAEIAAAWGLGLPAPARHRRPRAHPGHRGRRRRDRLPGVLRAAPARRRRSTAVRFDGADGAGPAPGVLDAIADGRAGGDRPVEPDRVDRPGARRARRARAPSRPGATDVVAVSPDRRRRRPEGPGRPAAPRAGPRVVGGRASPASTPRWPPPWSIDEADADHGRRGGGRGHALRGRPDDHARSRPRRPPWPEVVLAGMSARRSCPIEGIPEVRAGDDLAGLIAAAAARPAVDGDVVVVTQKVVSKAEGAMVRIDPDDPPGHKALVEDESVRILRRRGDLIISETRHGFVCANAGVDLSNVDEGWAALLPDDSDRSARRIRDGLRAALGVEVAVIVSDTFGRPGAGASPTSPSAAPASAPSSTCGAPRTAAAGSCRSPRCAWSTSWPRAAELVMGKATGVAAAVVRGVDPAWLGRGEVRGEIVRPPPRTCSAEPAGSAAEPGEDLGRRRWRRSVHGFQPRWMPARPGSSALRASSPVRAGAVDGRARSTPAASAMACVELVDRGLDAGADVAEQAAAPVGGPHEGVDHVVDVDEVAGLGRRRRRSCTACPSSSSPAKIATTPASPCGSWRGP